MFTPLGDDIFIASYPRSGTTWMQLIVLYIVHGRSLPFDHISQVIPFLDMALQEDVNIDHLTAPRILKTHLPYRRIFSNIGTYIYMVRDGRDVLVSYFHFYRTYFHYRNTFPDFFHDFIHGRLQYGSWFEHVSAWTAHAKDPRLLVVPYESLTANLAEWVYQIAAHCKVRVSLDTLSLILEHSSLKSMREQENKFTPRFAGSDSPNGAFIRKGKVGEWRDYFTKEQAQTFDDFSNRYFEMQKDR